MSRINGADVPAQQNTLVGNSIEDLDLDVFLNLMLTELQNQDPLNPMENDELLNTISQIREISANDKLSETLESVLLGQNVATATSLIGTEVEGLTDSGRRVTGEVRNVVINDGEPIIELAVASSAEAGSSEGNIEEGRYLYEVAWESEGITFSVQVPVDTEDLAEDFQGSIRIENQPDTGNVPKRVYRTDRSGTGELQLIGAINNGSATAFVDALDDKSRQSEALTGTRQVLGFADAIEVKLSNIDRVETLK
jgi:flagellar basal-body rod modification protein FlgD